MSSSKGLSVPKSVLVIGAGPTGLVGLRNLVERGAFERVELWERRDDIGGVWYLDDAEIDSTNGITRPKWPSPAYKGLIGNVLPEFLSFSEFPFPKPPTAPHQPFPSLIETLAYLRAFAAPYLNAGKIKLNREVINVRENGQDKGWTVTYRDWNNEGAEVEEEWDAVAVAVGWYDHPVWPSTEGLENLQAIGLAKHAKWYRGPAGYEGKKILVIGNAHSANEMAAQISNMSDGPVYQSIRRPAFHSFPSLASERIKMVAPVSRYIPKGVDKFDALLADGSTLTDLDYVHCGTGYRPLPNFVHVLDEDGSNHFPLTSDEVRPCRVPTLHRLVMYARNPSLAFIGAPMVYTPFTVADVVSSWLALAWRGEVPYPDTPEDRLAYERERLCKIAKIRSEMEDPTSFLTFSVMATDEQGYAAGFREEVVKARPELDSVLPVWSDERTEEREAMFKIKYDALEYARNHPCQM